MLKHFSELTSFQTVLPGSGHNRLDPDGPSGGRCLGQDPGIRSRGKRSICPAARSIHL